MRIPYVFERFHFTHVYHYPHINWNHVETIDHRLGKLNCKLCLLTIDDSILAKRIIHGRDSGWREYLKRYGENDEEIVAYYVKQQNLLRDLCRKSVIETIIIDTTNLSIEETLERMLNFWDTI